MYSSSLHKKSKRLYDADILYPVVFTLFLILLWEFTVAQLDVTQAVLPQPSTIFGQMVSDFHIQRTAAQVSLLYILSSFIIGSIIGIGFAIGLSLSPTIEQGVQPILVVMFVIPKIVVAPIFFVWFGPTWQYFLLVPVLLVFFPVMENTLKGLKTVPEGFKNLSRAANGSLRFQFRHVNLPHALPQSMAGLKIGMRQAVVGVIIAEFIAPEQGLGQLIIIGTEIGQPLVSFGAIVSIILIGVTLYGAVELASTKLVFWNDSGEQQ